MHSGVDLPDAGTFWDNKDLSLLSCIGRVAGNFHGIYIFKNFVVQTKFVKHKTLKYFKSITQILDIAKIRKNYLT